MASIVLLATTFFSHLAKADEEATYVEYQAPPEEGSTSGGEDCPNEDDFLDRVRARTERVSFVARGEAIRIFRIRIERQAERWRGQFVMDRRGERPRKREIVANRCDDVASALATFTALAIDPDASISDVPIRTVRPKARRPSRKSAYSAPSSSTPPSSAPRWELDLDLQFAGVGGISRSLAPGLMGSFEATPAQRSALLPSLRVSLLSARGWVPFKEGAAKFSLTTALVEICSLRIYVGDWELAPCLTSGVGVLAESAARLPGGDDASNLWIAIGGMVYLRWNFSPILALMAEGGILSPLLPKDYTARPTGELVFSMPRLTGMGSLGLAIRF